MLMNRSPRPMLLAAVLCVSSFSGCGLSRQWRWFRPATTPTAISEPQYPEYSPEPIGGDPFNGPEPALTPMPDEVPPPVFQGDPPPPSVSEYLSPPTVGHSIQPNPTAKPGLIAPRNARRLSPTLERPTSAEASGGATPSFEDGPVASSLPKTMFGRVQQVVARDPR